jgi:YVTN family beta-propeller protein
MRGCDVKRVWIFSILLVVFAVLGCSRDSNPLEDEPVPQTPEVEHIITQSAVILKWKPCEGAAEYRIYKSRETDSEYVALDVVADLEFRDPDVVQDDTYQYMVAAITAGGLEGYDSDPVAVFYHYEPPELTVYGTVLDSRIGKPIDRVRVSMNGDAQITNPAGEFAFVTQEYGDFTLLASKDGYILSEVSATVDQGEPEPIRVRLRPLPKLTGTISRANQATYITYIAFSRDGDKAYVTNNGENSVTVINAFSDTVKAVVPVGDGPIGIAANPEKDEVYVANNLWHSISVIETESDRKVAEIENVGNFPTSLIVSPDGDWLYSANSRSNNISVIDINQRSVKDHIPVGEEPYGLAIAPDGAHLYVTNKKAGTVSVVDVRLKRQVDTVGVGQDPADIIVSPDGQRIYVSADRLMVIDASTNTIVRDSLTANPRGLAIIEDVVYVVARMDNRVELFDTTRNMMLEQTIDVGMRPIGIATNGEKIYVANALDDTVSVLEFP